MVEIKCKRSLAIIGIATYYVLFLLLKEKKKKIEQMRNNHLSAYSWNNMDCNIQDKIFMTLNVMDLISSVSQVCNSIHLACCDRVLRKKLDLSKFKSNSFVRLLLLDSNLNHTLGLISNQARS